MNKLNSTLFAVFAIATLTAFAPPAAAAEYPWCSLAGGSSDDVRNCGFATYQQCMANVSGMGGSCERNQFYTGPAERPAKPARKRKGNDG
jgi:hypothetical protein